MDHLVTGAQQANHNPMFRQYVWGSVIAVSATLLGAALYFFWAPVPESEGHSSATQNFTIHEIAQEIPEIHFINDDEQLLTLKHFEGKTILLNVWATWCAPCVEEMPTLDRLQAELGSDGLEVVALSIDRAGPSVVTKFYNQIGVKNLQTYVDDSAMSATLLNTYGLPSTLLINEQYVELGRFVGPAKWDSPEIVSFLRTFIESP